jgi:pimeloyl-ACP methyl ester carboxylesterase
MFRRWGLFTAGLAAIVAGGLLAWLTQTSGGVRIEDVRFSGTNGVPMSALLYVPKTATARTPAPGILAVHGYINSRETQDGFAIEFARRGYVVLAIDQTGHGYSGGYAFENGFGGPDGLRYLRGLPMVDKANIGLEGHSMGGGAILAAAKAYPADYKAMVLEGSATGTLFSPPSAPGFPRNVAVVYSRFDEFSPLMWGVDRAQDVAISPKLLTLFGVAGRAVPGRLYGSMAAGDARQLYTPMTTHPGDHISTEAIGDALDWFGKTLSGGTPRPAGDQIWMWKEAGTLVAFTGFIALLLGGFDRLLALPVFASLAQPGAGVRARRDGRWWAGFWLTVLIPVVTFYPFMLIGMIGLPPSWLWPQSITNQIMAWAVLNGLITLLVNLLFRGTRPAFNTRWGLSILIALITVGIGYGALAAADALFKIDFRFWVVALKLMSPAQFRYFLAYLVPFTAFFVVALRALHANLSVSGDSAARQYLSGVAAMALGFALFLAAEYIPLFAVDHLLVPAEALNAIVSIQFLPLMAIVGLISVFTWRRTNSSLPGALICGLLVTWYMVAGTAVQFRG